MTITMSITFESCRLSIANSSMLPIIEIWDWEWVRYLLRGSVIWVRAPASGGHVWKTKLKHFERLRYILDLIRPSALTIAIDSH